MAKYVTGMVNKQCCCLDVQNNMKPQEGESIKQHKYNRKSTVQNELKKCFVFFLMIIYLIYNLIKCVFNENLYLIFNNKKTEPTELVNCCVNKTTNKQNI